MKTSILISSIAHVLFLVVIVVPGYRRAYLPGPAPLNVTLVAAPKSKPEPKPEATVVKEEQPRAKEPEKKPKMTYKSPTKKKTTEKKPPAEKSTKPAPAPKASSPKAESKGGSSSKIRVDEKDFAFAYYLEIIRERISSNWMPPPVSGSGQAVRSTVYFRIARDGTISDLKVEQDSPFDLFDRSAVRAVQLSSPLPPLPAGFGGRWLGVHFEFEHASG